MKRTLVTFMLWSAFGVAICAGRLDLTAPRNVFLAACAAVVLVMVRHAPDAEAEPESESYAVDAFVERCTLEPGSALGSPVSLRPYDSPAAVCAASVQRWRDNGFELLGKRICG